MGEFRDPAGLSRAAILALCASMIFQGLVAITRFYIRPGDPPYLSLAILNWVALIACSILVGCWIYRTNANAQRFGGAMTISPGWAVGWFFIPFVNLVMPFRAMNETWQASHKAAGLSSALRSPLVGWWWALWIAANIVSGIGLYLANQPFFARNGSKQVNLIAWAIVVAATLVLIQLMARLNRAQRIASSGSVFA